MDTLEKLLESGLHNAGEPLKLHLGCGATRLPGYLNIDFPQEEHNVMTSVADAEADIVKDLNFPRFSVDEIRSHHMFEHLSRIIALAQLVKWHYWLKVDGILIIETPDFMRSVKQLADELTDYQQKMAIVRHLTGDQAAPWGFHTDQWWNERFETTLSCLSFHIVDINYLEWDRWPHLRSIKVTATKVGKVSIDTQIEKCLLLLKDSMVSEREVATFNVWKDQLIEALKEVV
jgi:predicted SAM-dependent methyltransferase